MAFRKPQKIGIIGLGVIGAGVAAHLRRTGWDVFVWNRSPKPFPAFLPSPAELAARCDVIQIFVSDGPALQETVRSLQPALGPRHTVTAHPTVSPSAMKEAAAIVTASGAAFLEAPFTGSKDAAAQGRLVYYAGGSAEALDRARKALEASSRQILHTGETGSASVLKIATNMITAATVQALAEALALVKASGLDPGLLVKGLENNAARSGAVDLKLPKMLAADYSPHFALRHMLKDSRLAAELAQSAGLDIPLTRANAAILQQAVGRGWGDEDFSATFRAYSDSPPEPSKPDTDGNATAGAASPS